MTEPMKPELGALPWKPTRTLRMVRELNRWDVPTAGILKHRWRRLYYLFRCLDGASAQYSVWAYARLDRSDVRELGRLMGEELRQRQIEILFRGKVSIAVAEEKSGVIHRVCGRLAQGDPEPKLAPEVSRRVKEEIQDEARAIQGMTVFA